MTVWYKQGVMGCLEPIAQKGLGRVAGLYAKHGYDLFITSIREGTHSAGSLHPLGLAFDFRYAPKKIEISDIKTTLGPGWDVIGEGDHIHAEYDPK